MKIRFTESVSGSFGSFVKGWVYEVNPTCPKAFADEQIKIGYAELVEDEQVEAKEEVASDAAPVKAKKKTMKKAAPKSVEGEQSDASANAN